MLLRQQREWDVSTSLTQTAGLRRTSSGRSICLYPGKYVRCSKSTYKFQKSQCLDIWIRPPRHNWPRSWSSMEDPVVPLERNLYGHPLAGLLWKRQLQKILLMYGWVKVSNWKCFIIHREKGLFLSLYVDDIKLAGKKQHINPMWKVLNKVDLGEPTYFLDHVYLVCPQGHCEMRKDTIPPETNSNDFGFFGMGVVCRVVACCCVNEA